jgi:hypothetical protein
MRLVDWLAIMVMQRRHRGARQSSGMVYHWHVLPDPAHPGRGVAGLHGRPCAALRHALRLSGCGLVRHACAGRYGSVQRGIFPHGAATEMVLYHSAPRSTHPWFHPRNSHRRHWDVARRVR